MSEENTSDKVSAADTSEQARAGRGAADIDPFEVMEGLQAQIDDLTRTVERHQAILERLTSSDPPRKEA